VDDEGRVKSGLKWASGLAKNWSCVWCPGGCWGAFLAVASGGASDGFDNAGNGGYWRPLIRLTASVARVAAQVVSSVW